MGRKHHIACGGSALGLQVKFEFMTDHLINNLFWSGLLDRGFHDALTVSDDSHRITNAEDLGNTVRDIDNRHAVLSQALQHIEQVIGFRWCQRCRGLIQDQHLGLTGDRTSNFDELAQGYRKTRNTFIDINTHTDFIQCRGGDRVKFL